MKIKREISVAVLLLLTVSFPLNDAPLFAAPERGFITLEAVSSLEQGRRSHNRGDLRGAIRSYDRFLSLVPGRAEVYYRRGSAYAGLGELERAIGDYDAVLKIAPDYVEAYNNRGVAYFNLGRTNEAIQDYDRAISLRPGFAEAYNNRGTAYVSLGDLNRGLRDYFSAISWNERFAEAYYNRGTLHSRLGSLSQAIRDFSTAIELQPGYGRAYYNRGVVYGKLGDRARELDDYKRAVELDPRLSGGDYIRGTALDKSGVPGRGARSGDVLREEAVFAGELSEIRKRLDEIASEQGRLRHELTAAVVQKEERLDYGRNITEDVTKMDVAQEYNREALAWTEKSNESVQARNWDEVIKYSSLAINSDPAYPMPYVNRSWAYLEKGLLDASLDDSQRALELDGANAAARNNRGLYFLRTGQPDRAKDDFNAACDAGLEVGCNNLQIMQ